MSDALYTKDILRLAADIPRHNRLSAPHVTITKVSPICGSRVIIDLCFEDGRVSDYGQEVRACALGQAAAAIMGKHVVGRPLDELIDLPLQLRAMLKDGAAAPAAPWDVLQIFEPARAHKGRHGSILLSYEAVADAITKQAALEKTA